MSENKSPMIARLVLCLGTLLGLFFNTLSNFGVVEGEPTCMEDKFVKNTSFINEFLLTNPTLKYIWMIFTFIILDLSFIFTSIIWIFKGKNYRLILSLSMLYIFRLFTNLIFEIKDHEEINWEYSGFPSLTVSYLRSNNNYFSGVVGTYLILILDLFDNNYRIQGFCSIFGIINYILLMLSLRVEYYVSLFSGLISSHYFYIISNHFNNFLDAIPAESKIRLILSDDSSMKKEIIELK